MKSEGQTSKLLEYIYINIKNVAIEYVPKLLVFYIIVSIFFIIAKYYRKIIIVKGTENNINKKIINSEYNINKKIINSKYNLLFFQLSNLVYYIIIIIGFIFGLVNLGVQTSTIITLLGASSLAIGLACQGVLSSLMAGIVIGLNNTFTIGDTIGIGSNLLSGVDRVGVVKSLSLLTTRLATENGFIDVPNNMLQNSVVQKYSRLTTKLENKNGPIDVANNMIQNSFVEDDYIY
jgi:small-conductance mechanosensitive channel